MLVPLAKLTRRELEARERWHLELAQVYDQQGMASAVKTFLELAAVYRAELDKRPPEPETPAQVEARERRQAALAVLRSK